MRASALKKSSPEPIAQAPKPTSAGVEKFPPALLTKACLGTPGPHWVAVPGHEASIQGEHIKPGLYRYDAKEAREIQQSSEKTWAILHRWKTNPGPLPARPPAQQGVRLKD